ncbi:hypothetical protein LTR17_024450 [Elasticomyces elasticus]|nr:hypothetical protein LTR17_024450 [Elasticomyces elasticus]
MSSKTSFTFEFNDRVVPLSTTGQSHDGTNRTEEEEVSLSGFSTLSTVDDLVVSLALHGVHGPLVLSGEYTEKQLLGMGAQFGVYKDGFQEARSRAAEEHYISLAAVKRPLFKVEGGSRRLDCSSSKSRRQIHDMLLEVVALRHDALRAQRNIVRLLGWSVEDNFQSTPLLVVELAFADLRTVFEKSSTKLTFGTIQQLSIDIGQGLDAIHKAGIIHGDVKPQNILIFENLESDFYETVPYVAKLADFGLSVGEVKETMNDKVYVAGMSTDWCAPEIRQGAKLSTSRLIYSDNFSYGLVLASMSCYQGQAPKTKDLDDMLDTLETHSGIPVSFRSLLRIAVAGLLQHDISSRTLWVGELLKDGSTPCVEWEFDEAERQRYVAEPSELSVNPWSLPALTPYLFYGYDGLKLAFERHHETMTGPHFFAMFLARSHHLRFDQSTSVKMLSAAVERGYLPAAAVLNRVLETYGMDRSSDETLLYQGVAHGSLLAWQDLSRSNLPFAIEAWSDFRHSSGYNQILTPIAAHRPGAVCCPDSEMNSAIHVVATRGDLSQLPGILDRDQSIDIDAQNVHGETALYKACLRGDWAIVDFLCKAGANASVPSYQDELTCLHWLFSFPELHVTRVVTALLAANANIDALIEGSPTLANPHFPFHWPPGTPLHYAVFASSKVAVVALLKHDARLDIRDGRDPYLIDDNVRKIQCHGDGEEGSWSELDEPCLGFNPLDLAAAMHDHEMLACIRSNNDTYDLASADEKGYTPFHRLSHLRMAHSWQGRRFWYPAFTGPFPEVKGRMIKTIKELQLMGGDIDRLTSASSASPDRIGVAGLTPLMIAVTKMDHTAVEALLECGADPNITNADGRTALTLLPGDLRLGMESFVRTVELLIRFGADTNHKSLDRLGIRTPLVAVTMAKCTPAFRLLADAGADLTFAPEGVNVVAQLMWRCKYHDGLTSPQKNISGASSKDQEDDVAKLLEMLNLKEDPWASSMDVDGSTLLHYAVYSGLSTCIVILIEAGFDVNRIRRSHSDQRKGYLDCKMPEGTTLDIVEEDLEAFLRSGRVWFSEEDSRCVVSRYEEIRSILQCSGAVRSKDLVHSSEVLADVNLELPATKLKLLSVQSLEHVVDGSVFQE